MCASYRSRGYTSLHRVPGGRGMQVRECGTHFTGRHGGFIHLLPARLSPMDSYSFALYSAVVFLSLSSMEIDTAPGATGTTERGVAEAGS